jgi:hypothetical protein
MSADGKPARGRTIILTDSARKRDEKRSHYALDVFYTYISCLGGVFAKNTSLEIKFPSPKFSLKTGIFRKYPSQT